MSKSPSFYCQTCSATYTRWQGKCIQCGNWNTIEERVFVSKGQVKTPKSEPQKLHEVSVLHEHPFSSGVEEMDLVLGGGFRHGSTVLFGGEPGIGKSTLALQAAIQVSQEQIVLYVTGEETEAQVLLRAKRLGFDQAQLYVMAQTDIAHIEQSILRLQPALIVLDSIQVMHHPDIPSISGSVAQVRECAGMLIHTAKQVNATLMLIGHITKDGALAGPKVLEHMVDVILVLEGERDEKYRTLRCYKNRFSNTDEIGLFEIRKEGLYPSAAGSVLDWDTLKNPGAIISVLSSGNRGILIEIQALVVSSGYGTGKRTFIGVDSNRSYLMIAAIEKLLGIRLYDKDIIVNIVNGLKCTEPSIDLAVVLAILSSLTMRTFPDFTGVIGEVGLTGELRPVPNTDKRIMELYKMGIRTCVLPKKSVCHLPLPSDLTQIRIGSIQEATSLLGGALDD